MGFKPCCCISSKTGAFIIGYLTIILSILGILYMGICLVGTRYIENAKDPVTKEHFMSEIRKGLKEHPEFENADDKTIISMLYIVQVGLLLGCIINLIPASFLIHGLRKERLRFIQADLILFVICLAVLLVAALVSDDIMAFCFGSFSVLALSYVINTYLLIVIYAAYIEIRNKLQAQNPAVKHEHA